MPPNNLKMGSLPPPLEVLSSYTYDHTRREMALEPFVVFRVEGVVEQVDQAKRHAMLDLRIIEKP